ncbi:MAG: PilZ domain-containing protein [Spirochaetales bacterium]|nr:PilZ domain-containing protein [Spirochaetales bacterium]
MKEKRKNSRIPICLDIDVTLPSGGRYTGRTVNISFGGFLATIDKFPPCDRGDECDCEIILQAGTKRIPLRFRCTIIHRQKRRTGFQFLYIIGLDSYTHFKNLMILNCEKPEELLNELEEHPGLSIENDNRKTR